MNEPEEKKLNCRQACEFLGCSRSQFYRLIQKGILPAWRISGSSKGLWVYESDCAKLIEKIAERAGQP